MPSNYNDQFNYARRNETPGTEDNTKQLYTNYLQKYQLKFTLFNPLFTNYN